MRVVVLGPMQPYRGGIAHHTTAMFDALRARSEAMAVSYTRLYPSWLYPGSNTKESDKAELSDPECYYLLDSINPMTWGRVTKHICSFSPDLIVIPWWTFFLAPCLGQIARKLRSRGIHVRFLCHNVSDHSPRLWKAFLTRCALRSGSSYIVQSHAEADQLRGELGAVAVAICPHPVESNFPPPSVDLPRRAKLEALFFGLVRPYKGVEDLINAVDQLSDADIMLTIAGEVWAEKDQLESLVANSTATKKIELVLRYIDDQEAANMFARSDVVVLPYRSVTGSGVLGNAWHFGKPVVASDLGSLKELVSPGETGWLVPPSNPELLAETLKGITRQHADSMKAAIEKKKSELTWERLAECVLTL